MQNNGDAKRRFQGILPMYEQIKRDIRSRIDSGGLKTGDYVGSEQQLGKEWRVSRGVTRQALRDLETEGYVIRAPGRGTFVAPLEHRRARLTSGMGVLTVAFPRRQDYYHQRFLDGFVMRASEAGYDVTFYYLAFNREQELRFLSDIKQTGTAGVAIWPCDHSPEEREMIARFYEEGFPCVVFDQALYGLPTDFVGTDNVEILARLTTELAHQGHERIGYISLNHRNPALEDRFRGYLRALEQAGITVDPDLYVRYRDDDLVAARNLIERLVLKENCPTAIACPHEGVAWFTLRILQEHGLRVPEDIVIATLDDSIEPAFQVVTPFITALQNGHAIGNKACELLLARIAHPQKPVERHLIKAGLLEDYAVPLSFQSTRD
jgi:GntR family transcriptional regulator, arabinose operon transcriptional repressor